MDKLVFKTITIQNFMRFGDKKTFVDLNSTEGLTLVTGNNGHGKSTILDALSFVLTGKPLRKAAIGKMVNNINGKNLIVSLDVIKGKTRIRIIRGQKPGICKLYIDQTNQSDDIEQEKYNFTRNSTTETSKDILKLLGFDSDLFRCMVVNSTRTPTFFQSDSSTQKSIMENLFGFDILTEKAGLLKVKREETKQKLEIVRSLAVEKKASIERTKARIQSLEEKLTAWDKDHAEELKTLQNEIERIREKSPDDAISKFKIIEDDQKELSELAFKHRESKSQQTTLETQLTRIGSDVFLIEKNIEKLSDIDSELEKIESNDEIKEAIDLLEATVAEKKNEVSQLNRDIRNNQKQLDELENDTCPTCGQEWSDIDKRKKARIELSNNLEQLVKEKDQFEEEVSSAQTDIGELKSALQSVKYSSKDEIERLLQQAENYEEQLNRLFEEQADVEKNLQMEKDKAEVLSTKIEALEEEMSDKWPNSYNKVEDAIKDKTNIERYLENIESKKKEENPHKETLAELNEDIPDEIAEDKEIAELENDLEHYQYLEKLLTRKDSPIRRRVTAKYLPFLNERMNKFLTRLGLPYSVEFTDELLPEVYDFDSEIDPGALSGGEEERVVMALNWAFRECWEELHGCHLSFAAIDERLDSGLDGEGAEASMDIIREMSMERGRNIWVVTHRKEFDDYAQTKYSVKRAGRFSEIQEIAS
jgi:DNA repair exonuclease SbcCD ATPase subunit